MHNFRLPWLLILLVWILTGCAGVDPQRYADTTPKLDIGEYFDGKTHAWGMVQDYSGEVKRRFTVEIDGHLDGDSLVLDEHFVYADGGTDRRVWTFERQEDGLWIGSANDVEGPVEARQSGHAFNMTYRLPVEIAGREVTFTLDDWMYLQPDGRLINRTAMKKFGVTLAEITIVFDKTPDDDTPGA